MDGQPTVFCPTFAVGCDIPLELNMILITDRLGLTPFQGSDLELLHAIFTDPFVREYLWDDQVIDVDQAAEVLAENERLFAEARHGLWKIEHKESQAAEDRARAIGFTGLWYFFEEPQPQLIYGLLPEFAGKGYAREAAGRIVRYAFESLGFDYLLAAMDIPHGASRKVAEAVGMRLAEEKAVDGKATAFYRIDRADWKP